MTGLWISILISQPVVINVAVRDFFFFIQFFFQRFQYFSYPKKKGKKRICGHPSGHNFGHPLDRKETSFYWWSCADFPIPYLVSMLHGTLSVKDTATLSVIRSGCYFKAHTVVNCRDL